MLSQEEKNYMAQNYDYMFANCRVKQKWDEYYAALTKYRKQKRTFRQSYLAQSDEERIAEARENV